MSNLRLPEQNNVVLVGRLTRDAELRFTSKSQPVCSFDIAVNRRYKDTASNEWKDDVSYIPIVTWGPAAERCNERGKKGAPVHITGRLKSRSWETKDGQKRSTLEVIATRVQFLMKMEGAAGGEDSADDAVASGVHAVEVGASAKAGQDEEIPF
jgi:single-strand DNA-binding protein